MKIVANFTQPAYHYSNPKDKTIKDAAKAKGELKVGMGRKASLLKHPEASDGNYPSRAVFHYEAASGQLQTQDHDHLRQSIIRLAPWEHYAQGSN